MIFEDEALARQNRHEARGMHCQSAQGDKVEQNQAFAEYSASRLRICLWCMARPSDVATCGQGLVARVWQVEGGRPTQRIIGEAPSAPSYPQT